MVKAGDLLCVLFDERLMEKAKNMTKLFSSWKAIAAEERIVSAVDHSCVARFERNTLLIEADHPGWIQILQTKQQDLLDNFRRRFPNMDVRGISFRLSRGPIRRVEEPKERTAEEATKPAAQEDAVAAKFERDETLKRIVERLERSLR